MRRLLRWVHNISYKCGSLPLTGPARPFFGLIIGIDKYKEVSVPNLQGCVADSHDIVAYLTRYIGISDDHISMLFNEKATHANIMKHILAFATDNRIAPNDPILIYYAGWAWHIGGIDAPTSVLHPYDAHGTSCLSDNLCIPDMMFNSILAKVAAAKGDNIVRPSLRLWSYSDDHLHLDRDPRLLQRRRFCWKGLRVCGFDLIHSAGGVFKSGSGT